MSERQDALYNLLPAVHRMRDAKHDHALRDVLRVIAAQAAVIEDDIRQQYEDWFVETASPWALAYIGDLIGWDGLPPQQQGSGASLRADIANTIGHRRRKGARSLLEQLARDVGGWPAVAVEYYRLLGWTQHLDHQHLERARTVDVRDQVALECIGGAFDQATRNVDVRRVASRRARGQANIPSVGVHAFRLRSVSVTKTPAYKHENRGGGCFTFSILGNDSPLFLNAQSSPPRPLRRWMLEAPAKGRRPNQRHARPDVCAEGASFAIYAPDWPTRDAPQPIPAERVIPADLSDWRYRAPRDHVLVDTERGRIIFPARQRPKQVRVSYHYGAPAHFGGGEYKRANATPADALLYRVRARPMDEQPPAEGVFDTIAEALTQWNADLADVDKPRSGVIELSESGVYRTPRVIEAPAGSTLYIRAASGARPVLRLLDSEADADDALVLTGGRGARIVLDGLLISGRGVSVEERETEGQDNEALCEVVIRHCTLTPGWGLTPECEPAKPAEPSIVSVGPTTIRIEHSIVGAIRVLGAETRREPSLIQVSDSVIDGTALDRVAISGEAGSYAFAALTIVRSTIVGEVRAHAIELAENSIFTSIVKVVRSQRGCMRYSFVPQGSRTPRTYRCQPALALEAVRKLPAAEKPAETARIVGRVRPQFEGLRYGLPSYCRLLNTCGDEIWRGADDRSEMGVFHDLFDPARAANLQARLEQHTPADMQAGLIFAT